MRAIDADKLLEKSYEVGSWMPVRVINVNDIENAETIDAEPVRHGRWIPETYSISKCSMCEQHHFAHVESWKYCPNCGARME